MSVQEFYELFEAHRAAGFPELELPIQGSPDTRKTTSTLVALDNARPHLPAYVRWEIGEGVHPEELEAVLEGVQIMYEFGRDYGLPDIQEPITAYVHRDEDKLVAAYAQETGWSIEGDENILAGSSSSTRGSRKKVDGISGLSAGWRAGGTP